MRLIRHVLPQIRSHTYVPDLEALEPASLSQQPEGVHTSSQALHTHAARRYWEDSLWEQYYDHSMHSAASMRLKARPNSIFAIVATKFLES